MDTNSTRLSSSTWCFVCNQSHLIWLVIVACIAAALSTVFVIRWCLLSRHRRRQLHHQSGAQRGALAGAPLVQSGWSGLAMPPAHTVIFSKNGHSPASVGTTMTHPMEATSVIRNTYSPQPINHNNSSTQQLQAATMLSNKGGLSSSEVGMMTSSQIYMQPNHYNM